MAKKILICLIMLILCSFFVLGSDFYFQKGKTIDIKITCFQNGANCDTAVTCNLTTMYPNSTIFIENKAMTYHSTYFSYEIADSNITGEYSNSMACISNVSNTYTLFSYEVNNKGNNEQPSFMNALIILIPLILGIIFIFATFGIGEEHPVLKVGLLLFSMLTFFMSISIAIINIGYYNTFSGLIDTLGLWIYVYGIIYILIIVYFLLYAISKLMDMYNKGKDARLNY